MALNACELEIDLFCRGIRIPDEVSLDGARGISRTRAGLGSGLEVVIPGGSWLKDAIWVNVPVEERVRARVALRARGVAGRAATACVDEREPAALPDPDPVRAGVVHAADVARHPDEPHRRPAGHVPRDLREHGLHVLELQPVAQLPLLHDGQQRRRARGGGQGDRGRRRDRAGRQGAVGRHVRAPQRRVPGEPRRAVRRAVHRGAEGAGRRAGRRAARARRRTSATTTG